MTLALLLLALFGQRQPYETVLLDDQFLGEGAMAQDVDGDGNLDIVSGPFWWVGPSFKELRRPKSCSGTSRACADRGRSTHGAATLPGSPLLSAGVGGS